MRTSEIVKWLEGIAYQDVTREFCFSIGLDPSKNLIKRFVCPATDTSIQASVDFENKFATFSAEGNRVITRRERKWLENELGSAIKPPKGLKFHVCHLDA